MVIVVCYLPGQSDLADQQPNIYLEHCGRTQHPDELPRYNCLNFRNRKTGRPVPWFFTIDKKVCCNGV